MKKSILLLFSALCFSLVSISQEFTSYKVWTSENYYNSESKSNYDAIKEINYKDIKFTLNGDFDGNGTKEIALLTVNDNESNIYIVESFETQEITDPADGNNRGKYPIYNQHKTILKWHQPNTIFDFHHVTYAVVGDFNGDGIDEIAMFYDYGVPAQIDNRIFVTDFDRNNSSSMWWHNELQRFSANGISLDFSKIVTVLTGKFNVAVPNPTLAANKKVHDEIAIISEINTSTGNTPLLYLNFDDNNPTGLSTVNNPKKRAHFNDKQEFHGGLNPKNVEKYVVGNFYNKNRDKDHNPKGLQEIAMFYNYHDPSINNRIFLAHYYEPNNSTWYESKLEFIPGYMHVKDIKQAVSGDFDGNGCDEIAMFYSYGKDNVGTSSLQTVFFTQCDVNTIDAQWWYNPIIYENNTTLSFDKILFATANNFDNDTKIGDDKYNPRTDIALVYDDITNNNRSQDRMDNKILMYISKPLFRQNDFLLKQNGEPFFPLGWYSVAFDDLQKVNDVPSFNNKKVFNTVVANRTDYTTLSGKDYNKYYNFLPDYLNEASSNNNNLKVICDLRIDAIDNTHNSYYLSNSPFGIKDVFDNNPDLASKILGFCIADEPQPNPIYENSVLKKNGLPYDMIGQNFPTQTLNDFPVTPQDDKFSLLKFNKRVKAITNNLYNNNPNLYSFVSSWKEFDFDYFKDAYDVSMFDYYPQTKWSYNFYMPIYYWSRRSMESTIRLNKPSAFFIPQAMGVMANSCEPGLDYKDNSRIQTRFSSFSPIIEGIRGLIYYDYKCTNSQDDPMREVVNNVAKEVSVYTPILKKQTLNNRISCNKDRYVGNDFNDYNSNGNDNKYDFHNGSSRYCKLINYSLHADGCGNYYLFAVNNYYKPVNNVTFSIFNDRTYNNNNSQIPTNVYLINEELNGIKYQYGEHFTGTAIQDQSNAYVNLSTSFEPMEVKIFLLLRNKGSHCIPEDIHLLDNDLHPRPIPKNILLEGRMNSSNLVTDNISIYPNPSNGNFNIGFPINSIGANMINIFDIYGRSVLQQKTIDGTKNININLTLAKGIYTVQITNSATGKIETQKIIIQ